MARVALVLLAGLLGPTARAQPVYEPDEESARRHYAAGVAAYDRGDYQAALGEFERSRASLPSPALDYNIGRCLDRLERAAEAADAYQRFVDARPDAPEAATLRARIEVLRARGAVQPAAPRPPPRRWRVPAAVLAGAALALTAAGAGVIGDAAAAYSDRRAACDGACAPDDPAVVALHRRVRDEQIASGLLFGLAGATAVVDVALWVLDARSRREPTVRATR